MTERTPKLLLDAVTAAEAAREFLGNETLEEYVADRKTRSAVERQLEILGEACSRLAKLEPSLLERAPAMKLAIGLRNRVIHGYDSVDHGVVHETVREDLPALIAELSRLLSDFRSP